MNDTWNPRIVVMGAGAMGGLFGSILTEGSLDVTLVDVRTDHIDAIRRHGLRVIGFGGERSVRMPATTDAGEIADADLVLFQCKSHATQTAARAARHLVEGGAVTVSFQNGLGNEERIGSVVGMQKCSAG